MASPLSFPDRPPTSCSGSVLQVVLSDPLSRQLRQDVVQVVGVGVPVARQVGAELRLVVNLVPHHRVRLPGGAGCADGEDQASVPRCDQQLQDLVDDREEAAALLQFNQRSFQRQEGCCANLPALVVVWEVAVPREAPRTELLAGVRVLLGLWRDGDTQRQRHMSPPAGELGELASFFKPIQRHIG